MSKNLDKSEPGPFVFLTVNFSFAPHCRLPMRWSAPCDNFFPIGDRALCHSNARSPSRLNFVCWCSW